MNNIKILLQNTGMTTTNYKKGCDDCIACTGIWNLFEKTLTDWNMILKILYTDLYDIVIKNFREKFSTAETA
jgi:hypothetical protein